MWVHVGVTFWHTQARLVGTRGWANLVGAHEGGNLWGRAYKRAEVVSFFSNQVFAMIL